MIGTIKRLVKDRGFGFVKVGETEYFFHFSAVPGGHVGFAELNEDQRVEVEEDEDERRGKGPRAKAVRPL